MWAGVSEVQLLAASIDTTPVALHYQNLVMYTQNRHTEAQSAAMPAQAVVSNHICLLLPFLNSSAIQHVRSQTVLTLQIV